ncbi:hypothetical protein KW791_00610 [Candidatus Parcubacteria bacterium]|nr:hypothetical protein [Candidatus Parcubacteria bacterium]
MMSVVQALLNSGKIRQTAQRLRALLATPQAFFKTRPTQILSLPVILLIGLLLRPLWPEIIQSNIKIFMPHLLLVQIHSNGS